MLTFFFFVKSLNKPLKIKNREFYSVRCFVVILDSSRTFPSDFLEFHCKDDSVIDLSHIKFEKSVVTTQ